MNRPVADFSEPPTEPEAPRARISPFSFLLYYWNALLACIAMGFHCIVFAAFNFIDDGGSTGNALFPLAPIAMLLGVFCIAMTLAQLVVLWIAFVKQSSGRYHRLLAIAITWGAILLILVAGQFGWFIHV